MWNSTETDSVRTESELWLWNAMCGLCMTRHWHLQWTWEEGTSSRVQRLTEGQFNMCVSVKFACGGKQGKGCTFSIWINRKYHHSPCILKVWLAERPQDTENRFISNYAVDANFIQQLSWPFPQILIVTNVYYMYMCKNGGVCFAMIHDLTLLASVS